GTEGAIELLGGEILDLLVRGLKRGVVDQDIQPTELLDGPFDELDTVPFISYVARHDDSTAAGALDPTGRLLRVLVLIQIRDQNIGALPGECNGDGTAYAGIAAGNDGNAALEA